MNDDRAWKESPFAWVKGGITSRQKGKIGEEIVSFFLRENGFDVVSSPDSEADLVVDGKRVEVKFSTLWSGGMYTFQQLRNQNYDLVFCLGISPGTAHAWVMKKADIVWDELRNQHGGAAGSDTWWISFTPPDTPHSWMVPQDGDLTKVCDHLRALL